MTLLSRPMVGEAAEYNSASKYAAPFSDGNYSPAAKGNLGSRLFMGVRMATIKIINSANDFFPAQQVKLVRDTLNIRTYEGGERIYPIRDSIVSLDIVSQHLGNTVFNLKLCDGAQFKGEARKGVVHRFIKFTGASPHKVEERTARQVKQQDRWTTIRWVGIPLLVTVLFIMGSDPNAPDSQHHRINGANWHGCTNEKIYDNAVKLAAQGDRLAFAKYLTAGHALGVCTAFKEGEPIYIAESGILKVKVRRPGQTAEYWTDREAVR